MKSHIAECSNSRSQVLDEDEFEIRYSASAKSKACQAIVDSEFMKARMTRSLQSAPKPSTDLSLLGKLSALLAKAKRHFQRPAPPSPSLPFVLQDNQVQVLQPGESVVVGPILYQSIVEGRHNATLYIRNNHTIVETVSLTAAAELPTLTMHLPGSCSRNSVVVNIEWQDLVSQLTLAYEDLHYPIFKVPIAVELVNSKQIPVTVYSLLVGGSSCSAYGLTIPACDKQFTMQAQETLRLEMHYTPRFDQEVSQINILMVTEAGVEVSYVEVRVPYHILSYVRWKGFTWLVWGRVELLLTELMILVSTVLGGGVFVLLIWTDWTVLREAHYTVPLLDDSPLPMKLTEDEPIVLDYIASKCTTADIEEVRPSEEYATVYQPTRAPCSEVPAPERYKAPKKKIKEAKIHSEFNAEKPPKQAPVEAKVVATNTLILQSKAKRNRPTDFESDTTSSLADQQIIEDESSEVYLDTYRLKQLFAGPCCEWVPLQELS